METDLLDLARGHAASAVALTDGAARSITYGDLPAAVQLAADEIVDAADGAPRVLALLADNGPAWALVALAAARAGSVLLPLPAFFTAGQVRHALATAGATHIATDRPAALHALAPEARPCGAVAGLALFVRAAAPVSLPARTATITFTSGTTGEPKGVCLGAAELLATARALRDATRLGPDDRHLALLPLPVLLEEVGGLRRALLAGATAVLPPLEAVGLSGSVGLQAGRMAAALAEQRATSAILTPQMLAALVDARAAGAPPARTLRFLGVGGACVPVPLIERARMLGIPAYEGYGLTETGSVVALNTPEADRPGSVGRPLAHARVRIAADGEVLVRGPLQLGTLGAGALELKDGWLATGDVGSLDADGFLRLAGRRRNIFITSFGRNVSPEWIERELLAHPAVAAATVFGEGWPAPRAVLVPGPGRAAELASAVAQANERLPDYARVARFVVADAPFTPANGLATPNGRPRRTAILAAYSARLAPDLSRSLLTEFLP